MSVTTAERLSTLVERIYGCATDPALWPATLGKINEATDCAHSALGLVSFPEQRSLLRATSGFDDEFYARFNANIGRFEEIWGGAQAIARFPVDEPVVLSRQHPDALVRGAAGHDLLCRVLGFEVADTLNLPLVHVGQAVGTAAFARGMEAGRFDAQVSEFFRMLSPHLRRSTEINGLLEASTLSFSALDSLFDRLNAPVLIVNRSGRLVHANRAAETLLSSGLIATTADAKSIGSAALSRAVAAVASGSGETPHQLVIDHSSADAGPWTFHVIGLSQGENPGPPEFIAIIGAAVADPASQWLDAIGRNCGLTGTETGVLGHLLQGYSTDQVAAVLGVETSTVRTHLLHIYDKLGVHGRAELIVKVHSMVPPFLADDPALH